LNLGGGFSDFGTSCRVPSLCFNCKDVVGLNIFNKKHLCPKCRRKTTPLGIVSHTPPQNDTIFEWNIDGESEYYLDDKKYQCPKCGQEELFFESMGMWD
jgi:ribosomal protein L37AE/L43A